MNLFFFGMMMGILAIPMILKTVLSSFLEVDDGNLKQATKGCITRFFEKHVK
jgi:hypothetical protein